MLCLLSVFLSSQLILLCCYPVYSISHCFISMSSYLFVHLTFFHYYLSLHWLLSCFLSSLFLPCEPLCLQWAVFLISGRWEMWCFQVSAAALWWCQLKETCWDWQSEHSFVSSSPCPFKKWESELSIACFPRTSLEMSLQPSGGIHRKFLSNFHMCKSWLAVWTDVSWITSFVFQ